MKLGDLKNGSTWVVGVQGFSTALFIRPLTDREAPDNRFPWRWTSSLFKAGTFSSREDAEKLLHDARFRTFLYDTTSQNEMPRVRALKVELRVGT